MNQMEFHQRYEEESDQIYAALIKLDEDELLGIIADQNGSQYKIWVGNDNYQIWQVFQAKGTIKSIRPLFDIVSNLKNKYLIRFHACAALFVIGGIHDDNLKGEVQFGLNQNRERVDQQSAIRRLAAILNINDEMM